MIRKYLLPVLLVVQCILIFTGFRHHYQVPTDSLFHDLYDGFKNYHTLYTYVAIDTDTDGLLHYSGMNYPYGDFVTYTDNTPAIAIPMKLLVRLGVEPGPWIFWLFNQWLIAGILISTVLLFFILKDLLQKQFLVAVGALTLPWINPQLMRLSNGHFNLSQSWLVLLPIFLLLLYSRRIKSGRSLWPVELAMVGSIILASAYHLYYLPINGLIIGSFLLFFGIFERRSKRIILSSLIVPAVSAAFFLLFANGFDPFFELRSDTPTGFNNADWQLDLLSLITAYPHFGIDFIIGAMDHHHYESNSYLGGFVLYAGLGLLILNRWLKPGIDLKDPFMRAFLFAGVVSLITAFGIKFDIPTLGLHVENVISPMFWIDKVSDKVEHFRCLARFNWPFFWVMNLTMLWLVDRLILTGQRPLKIVAFGLTIFLLLDAKDAIRFNHNEVYENVLVTSDLEEVTELVDGVDPLAYEAILTIPFYHVGSMHHSYTIQPPDIFYRRAAQMSSELDLPLMPSMMSRTPVPMARKQMNIFTDPDRSSLVDLRTRKPLLVLASEQDLCQLIDEEDPLLNKSVWEVLTAQEELLSSGTLEVISSTRDLQLLRWTR